MLDYRDEPLWIVGLSTRTHGFMTPLAFATCRSANPSSPSTRLRSSGFGSEARLLRWRPCRVWLRLSPTSVSLRRFVQQPSHVAPRFGLRRSPLPRWVSRALPGPSHGGRVEEVPVSACTELLGHRSGIWALTSSGRARSPARGCGGSGRRMVGPHLAVLCRLPSRISTARSRGGPTAFARIETWPIRRCGTSHLPACAPNAVPPSQVSCRKLELPEPHSSWPPWPPRSPSKAEPTAGLGRPE